MRYGTDFADAPGLRDMIETAVWQREGLTVDDDDSMSIVEGLAVALESIDDHAEEYTDPALAAWIESVSEQMLALQTFLTENYTE